MCASALARYRSLGFQVGIDDLGEGFASFRMWSELRPQDVKADMRVNRLGSRLRGNDRMAVIPAQTGSRNN